MATGACALNPFGMSYTTPAPTPEAERQEPWLWREMVWNLGKFWAPPWTRPGYDL